MNAASPASFLYRLFFAPGAPEEKKLSLPAQYLCLLLLFIVTRLLAVWGFEMRHVDWLANDPGGYVATANYIAQHGYQPTEYSPIYRQFAGLSILMVVANFFIGNMVVAGYVVVVFCGLASIALIQYLFDDFRLSVIFTVFLPFCITTTSTIFSEAPTVLCFLCGLWVLRDFRDRPAILALGVLVAGYALVIRQSALFSTLPFLFVFAWQTPGGNFWRAMKISALALVPFVIYLSWNWLTIHQLFPQYRLQQLTFAAELASNPNPAHYSHRMYDIPFRSLIAGLTDPSERISKRASEIFSTAVAFIALGCLTGTAWREKGRPRGVLALAFFAGMLPYVFFLLSLGGNFGYKWMERHLSEINPMIDWALFYHRPLRWPWIFLLIVMGVVFAMATGQGGHFGIFK
jgi:hypothetical protein